MSGSRLAAKYGVTPGKLVLIGVLMVALVFVVYRNFLRDSSGGEAEASSAQPPAASPSQVQSVRNTKSATHTADPSQGEETPRKSWPRFDLGETIARDPFALPERFPKPHTQQVAVVSEAPQTRSQAGEAADDQRAAELAALQQKGVQLIMQNGREYVAKIGDKEVKVGEKIGSFRVVDISFHDGVEVEFEGDVSR